VDIDAIGELLDARPQILGKRRTGQRNRRENRQRRGNSSAEIVLMNRIALWPPSAAPKDIASERADPPGAAKRKNRGFAGRNANRHGFAAKLL